mgnify:CR=1 FL=1
MPAKQHHQKSRKRARCVLERAQVIAIAITVFVLPLLMWPGLTDYNYTKSIAALVLISCLLVLWGLPAWRRPSWKLHVPWALLPVAGLLLAGLLSLIQAANARVAIQSLILLTYFVLLLWMIANVVHDQRDVRWILAALLASGTLAALYGVLQYFALLPGMVGARGIHAMISTMGNRNHLGGFLLYLIYPSIILLLGTRSRWGRALAAILIGFTLSVMLSLRQAGTRVALIGATAALFVGALIFRPPRYVRTHKRSLLGLGGGITVLCILALIFGLWGVPFRASSEADAKKPWLVSVWETNSGKTRAWDWWIAADMLVDHPTFGAGLGHYKIEFIPSKADFLATERGQAYSFFIPSASQAHNEVVQVAAELGTIGLIMLLASLIMLAISLWVRLRRSNGKDQLSLLLLTLGILAFLAHSLVSFPAHVVGSSLEFILFCGLALSLSYGTSMSFSWELRGWTAKVAHIVLIAVGLTVSTVALADARANWLMERGIDQVQAGLFATAEISLQRSLALDFAPRQTYYYLAVAQIQLGKLDQAQINLEKCMTRFIDEASLLNYANLLVNTGQSETAFEPLDLLLASHPRPDIERRALYLRALAISETGDPDTAITLIEDLLTSNPSYETPYIGLGSIYESQDRIEEARATYTAGLEKVEKALTRTRSRITAAGETITADKAGELRAKIDKLTYERATLLERLRDLPASSSP